jgi:putative ABC transport system permease protein
MSTFIGRWLRRWSARIGVAWRLTAAQLRHDTLRMTLAVLGVTLAVLSVTLLAGTGIGVVDTGQQQFDRADRDLWVTAGETQLTSTGGGGFANTLYDARNISAEMESHEGVRVAAPLTFETVYVSQSPDGEFQTFVGTGVPGRAGGVRVVKGSNLPSSSQIAEGERANEVLIDRETAEQLNVSINDTLYLGGTLSRARDNEVTVVGISPTYRQMLGTPTVTMPLNDLYATTGTTATEPATFISITVTDDADVATVQEDLQAAYPDLQIRTNRQQLEATLEQQVLVLAAGAALVVLAVGTGIALTLSLFALIVYQQRREFAIMKAQGISTSIVLLAVMAQGLVIGLVGGVIGIALTPVGVRVLNAIAERLVGFEGLVQTMDVIYIGSFGMAVGIGVLAAVLAGWQVNRTPPLEHLR